MTHLSDMLRLNPYLLDAAPITPTERKYLKARLSGEGPGAIAKKHLISADRVYHTCRNAMQKLFSFAIKNPHWHPVYGSYRARMQEVKQKRKSKPVYWIGEST